MLPPQPFHIPLSRRRLLVALSLASLGFATRSAFAELLALTPRMTAGPFYPDHLPLDQDNDLIHVSDNVTPALGIVTNLSGRLLNETGTPVKGALLELWQTDSRGNYLHSRGEMNAPRDPHFQGYGKFETATDGAWKFRTIKPALYPGRTRHFHFGITLPGQTRRITTQLFFTGEPANDRDGILQAIRDPAARSAVTRDFQEDPLTKELATKWDIVLGQTPPDTHEEDDHGPAHHRPPGGS